VITDMSNLGWLALNTGDLEGAAARFAESAELSRRVYVEPHPNLVHAINAQAKAEQRLLRHETAEPLFREAVAMAGEVYGPDHASTADEVLALADCLTDMGRIEEADEMTRRAIGIHDRTFGPGHETTLRSRYNYAYSVYRRGDHDDAIPLLEESVDAYTAAVGRHHKNTALAINNLGRALRDAGRLEEAEDAFMETREIRVRILGPDHLLVAVADHDIGSNRFHQGRPEEADGLLNAALAVYDAQLDGTHSVFASIMRLMAWVDLDLDRPRQALERLERGRPAAVATKGEDHEEILLFDLLEGVARARLGEVGSAASVAETVEPKLAGLEPGMRAECLLELGRIHALTGRHRDAERALTEARDVFGGSYGAGHHLTGRAERELAALNRAR
jgi:tetratricopeptide (TPR) repeat protein